MASTELMVRICDVHATVEGIKRLWAVGQKSKHALIFDILA